MINLPCYDLNGNQIKYFTQWDTNQVVLFDGDFSSAPYVDFWNRKEDALRVESVLTDDGRYKVEIPNIFFLNASPLSMYIYVQDSIDASGKTIYKNSFPVREKPQSNDFEYADNVHVVSVIALERKLKELIEEMNIAIANCETATQAAYDAIGNINNS